MEEEILLEDCSKMETKDLYNLMQNSEKINQVCMDVFRQRQKGKIKIQLIQVHHNEAEYKLNRMLDFISDNDKSLVFLTESYRYIPKGKSVEDLDISNLFFAIELLLVLTDPECRYPACHGLACDMAIEDYIKRMFLSLIEGIKRSCEYGVCYPKFRYEIWMFDYDQLDVFSLQIISETYLLKEYINPYIQWMKNREDFNFDWNSLDKNINNILDNELCKESKEVVSDLIIEFFVKTRDNSFAKNILDKYESVLSELIEGDVYFYITLGSGHMSGVEKILRQNDIKLTKTGVMNESHLELWKDKSMPSKFRRLADLFDAYEDKETYYIDSII